MDTTGEGSSKKGRHRQDGGKKQARKKKATSPKISSVSQLIQQLQEIVLPDADTWVTKKEVLQQTRHYTMQLESTLGSLLKMTGLLEDGSPCSLEDIKVEYLQPLSSNQSPSNQIDPVVLLLNPVVQRDVAESSAELRLEQSNESLYSPDLMEFERYMTFYKHTADMLIEDRAVSPEQVTHPGVSRAISNLWQELLQDGKTDIYQKCLSEAKNTAACPFTYPSDAGCTTGGKRGSEAESQEAPSSFLSTPEDVLIHEAFGLAAEVVYCDTNQTLSNPGSSMHSEREKLLHENISDFLRARFFSYSQCDYDAVCLRCTETIDDEGDP